MCFGFLVGRKKGGVENVMYFPGGQQAEMVGEGEKHLRYFKGSLLFGSELPGGITETEIRCFQPHLIPNFPGGEVLGVLFFHDLTGSFMCG